MSVMQWRKMRPERVHYPRARGQPAGALRLGTPGQPACRTTLLHCLLLSVGGKPRSETVSDFGWVSCRLAAGAAFLAAVPPRCLPDTTPLSREAGRTASSCPPALVSELAGRRCLARESQWLHKRTAFQVLMGPFIFNH